MIPRMLEKSLKRAAGKYPVVAIIGPRQSGKTTLARLAFPGKSYVSLENPAVRAFAIEDPQGFLAGYPRGAILDEVQRAPQLFSYLQPLVDEKKKEGLFILTGSQHFLLLESVSQSLAGRVSIHKLLPLSLEELEKAHRLPSGLEKLLWMGGYPRIHDKKLDPSHWLGNYVETYLERDVRQIKNVGDLSTFHRFLRAAAARSAQLLNLSSLAEACGITHNTAKAWLSVLEASFVIFLLPPHYRNFNKRLKKSPKLYFFDTGLLCYLLGIERPEELQTHATRGAIFETGVLSEMMKQIFHRQKRTELFFWQDRLGREIDCLMDCAGVLFPVEIKSGVTLTSESFKNLDYWLHLSKTRSQQARLVYAGEQSYRRRGVQVLGWSHLNRLPI